MTRDGAPDLVDAETTAVLRKRWLTGNITGQRFDAAYVALAEELGCELLTADTRLDQAPGPRCDIRALR